MADTVGKSDHTVSATEARSRLSKIISQAEFSGERTVFTRHGEPVAALVSLDDLKALQLYEDAVDVKRARESIEDARQNGGTKSLEEFREELVAKRDA
jgi:prevent-host-death family protein